MQDDYFQIQTNMDNIKRRELIERIKILGLPSYGVPSPLVTLEEFFVGNDDFGSIGCNLTPMLGPQFFFEKLKLVRSLPNVQDVLVDVMEVEENDLSMWPFSDTVYIFTDAPVDDVQGWTAALQPDSVEPASTVGKPNCPEMKSGYNCFSIWWD
jgi:hypothetical protein